MPRRCTVCDSPARREIDRALVGGQEVNRKIAQTYGVSEFALWRHKSDHIPERLAKAQAAREVADADRLLDDVRGLRGKAVALLLAAEREGDLKTALQGVRTALACMELLAKLLGELDERPQVTVNLLASPEWVRTRTTVIEALAPYPEAAVAVAGALTRLGPN